MVLPLVYALCLDPESFSRPCSAPTTKNQQVKTKSGRHEPTVRLSCPAGASSSLFPSTRPAGGTGRAHRLSIRSTPEIRYGSNGFRYRTCFEEPLHAHCISRAEAASNFCNGCASKALSPPKATTGGRITTAWNGDAPCATNDPWSLSSDSRCFFSLILRRFGQMKPPGRSRPINLAK